MALHWLPEEAAVQQQQQQQPEAALPPADVWLPAHMLAASAGALQGGGTAAGGAPLWEALLFPGAAALPPEERHAGEAGRPVVGVEG